MKKYKMAWGDVVFPADNPKNYCTSFKKHFFAGIRHFSTCNYPRVYTLFRPLDMHTLSNRCCHTPLILMFFYT
jgi:hypothetical protein